MAQLKRPCSDDLSLGLPVHMYPLTDDRASGTSSQFRIKKCTYGVPDLSEFAEFLVSLWFVESITSWGSITG